MSSQKHKWHPLVAMLSLSKKSSAQTKQSPTFARSLIEISERLRVVDEPPLRRRGKSPAFDEGSPEAGKMNDSRELIFITPLSCTSALAYDTRWRTVGRAERPRLTASNRSSGTTETHYRSSGEILRRHVFMNSTTCGLAKLGSARLGPGLARRPNRKHLIILFRFMASAGLCRSGRRAV